MYSVRWLKSALNELAKYWVKADSRLRQAITAATYQIDQTLKDDPENKGESRGSTERVFFAHPLGVHFEVNNSKKIVRVLRVWTFTRRS